MEGEPLGDELGTSETSLGLALGDKLGLALGPNLLLGDPLGDELGASLLTLGEALGASLTVGAPL